MKPSREYGCPDWRTPDAYGDVDSWDDDRWRWEFKRRSPNYRYWYEVLSSRDHMERYPGKPMPVHPIWLPEYSEIVFFPTPARAAELGFAVLANPLYSERPKNYWDAVKDPYLRLERRTITRAHWAAVEHGTMEASDVLGHNVVAISFDLNGPILPQVEGLTEYLQEIQHRHAPKDIVRRQKDKWFRYLRVLDARQAKATWAECSAILANTISGSEQSARDTHRQAKLLQERL